MMADREKVISGLEIQLEDLKKYADNDQPLSLTQERAQEIIVLLKEHEPKPVELRINVYGTRFYFCPKCNRELFHTHNSNFCERCGQAVIWND